MREYGLSLLVAAALTYLVTPVVRAMALRAGAVAGVRDRDVHEHAIPRWGGLGMFLGLCAGMVLASKLPMMRSVFEGASTEGFALVSGAVIIVALGLADDKWELDAPTKMAGQVLAAAVMALQGITLLWLPIDGVLVLDPTTSVLLTVLIVLVSVNAINFIDGLDGLAAGITAVSAAAFFVYAYLLSVQFGVERATLSALVSALLVGISVGFLPHNVFPARLFMGDTGSMLIGYLMAASVITLTGKVDPNALEGTTLLPALLPILVPLAVLAVPLIDLAPGGGPPDPGRPLAVRPGQAAPAPPPARDGPLPAARGAAADRLGGADLLLRRPAGLHPDALRAGGQQRRCPAAGDRRARGPVLAPGRRPTNGGHMIDQPEAQRRSSPSDRPGRADAPRPARVADSRRGRASRRRADRLPGRRRAWCVGRGNRHGPCGRVPVDHRGSGPGHCADGPERAGASVLGSWIVKMVLLMVVLVLLREADFYSRPVLFVALLVGTVGTLLLEAFVVVRTRVPYVEPGPR